MRCCWLAYHDGFVYEGSTRQFTGRRELRRGIGYGYGYRRLDGKRSGVYLMRSEELARECFE